VRCSCFDMNYKEEDLNADRRCPSTKSYAPGHANAASVAADVGCAVCKQCQRPRAHCTFDQLLTLT